MIVRMSTFIHISQAKITAQHSAETVREKLLICSTSLEITANIFVSEVYKQCKEWTNVKRIISKFINLFYIFKYDV